jgi:hypothetical protein
MNIIEKHVQHLAAIQTMETYANGGTEYFDALDMCLRGEWQITLQLVLTTPVGRPIVLQGNFGLAVINLMNMHGIDRPGILWMKSSPRKDEEPETMLHGEITMNPIFLDDSCYSGKTIEAIDRYLMSHFGFNIQHTNVIYDGMRGGRVPSINSFYRHHDYC